MLIMQCCTWCIFSIHCILCSQCNIMLSSSLCSHPSTLSWFRFSMIVTMGFSGECRPTHWCPRGLETDHWHNYCCHRVRWHRKSFLIQVNNTEILFYTLQIASKSAHCGHKLQSFNPFFFFFLINPQKTMCSVVLSYAALLVLFLSCCAPVDNYQTYAIIVKGVTRWKECMWEWWGQNERDRKRLLISLREHEVDGNSLE